MHACMHTYFLRCRATSADAVTVEFHQGKRQGKHWHKSVTCGEPVQPYDHNNATANCRNHRQVANIHTYIHLERPDPYFLEASAFGTCTFCASRNLCFCEPNVTFGRSNPTETDFREVKRAKQWLSGGQTGQNMTFGRSKKYTSRKRWLQDQ